MAVVTFKEYGLQDGNTLEATQRMLESSTGVTTFPLNDQEILLRLLHVTTKQWVERFQKGSGVSPNGQGSSNGGGGS
jgi:hypothetical protein